MCQELYFCLHDEGDHKTEVQTACENFRRSLGNTADILVANSETLRGLSGIEDDQGFELDCMSDDTLQDDHCVLASRRIVLPYTEQDWMDEMAEAV